MTPQELKNSILQLAIQGKLVEQRPEEGTAEELFARIQEEKQRLISEKKIKKEKGEFGDFKEEEIPFDVPATWKWVRFGSIMVNRDSERIPLSVSQRSNLDKIYDYYGASGVIDKVDKYLFDKTLLLIGEDGANLLARSTPIAFLAKGQYWVNNHAHVLDCVEGTLSLEYIMYFINAISLAKYVTGTAQPKMNQEKMNSIPVSLPPLAEQKRIVTKIEELLPYIDQYEQAWSKLEQFNSRFPEDMKKSLLQYAIQGKLVEQRPEEGTAEELFAQIQGEKQRLIAEKKIKKEKPLPELTEGEKPFDIPESWKWVRLGSIFITSSGTTPARSNPEYYNDGKINWVRTTDLNNGVLSSCQIKISRKAFEDCRLEIIPRDSICIAMYGGAGTIGKNARIDFDTTINQSVCAIHPNNLCDMKYVHYFVQFFRSYWMNFAAGSRKDPNINQVIIKHGCFPLPPLAEQKRIVEKLEQLLPLCERLK